MKTKELKMKQLNLKQLMEVKGGFAATEEICNTQACSTSAISATCRRKAVKLSN
jgi:hypothetical protein